MVLDKRVWYAFCGSALVNVTCIALVGGSALVHPRPYVPKSESTAALHPVSVRIAEAQPKTAPSAGSDSGKSNHGEDGLATNKAVRQGPAGDSATGGGSADKRRAEGMIRAASSVGDETRNPDNLQNRDPAARSTGVNREQPSPPTADRSQFQRAPSRFSAALKPASPQTDASATDREPESIDARTGEDAAKSRSDLSDARNQEQDPSAKTDAAGNTRSASTLANWARRSVRYGVAKYGRAKVNLGTVHETRPKFAVTGGGMSDMRSVDITAHYVIDDPGSRSWTNKPSILVRKFPTKMGPRDTGNTAKCVPTFGNTSLGGYSLHGHDHITGTKYCVPGSGGAGASSGGGQFQAQTFAGQMQWPGRGGAHEGGYNAHIGESPGREDRIGQDYTGHGPALGIDPKPCVDAGTGGIPTNTLHLPSNPDDHVGLTPGASVPLVDRRWVADPYAHSDSAPPGNQLSPTPRFTVANHDIGSLDSQGTINWGKPHPSKHKRRPYGATAPA